MITAALEKYQLRETEPMRILCSVGGLDIAGALRCVFRWCKIPYADRGRRCHQCGGSAYSRAALPGNKRIYHSLPQRKGTGFGTSDAGAGAFSGPGCRTCIRRGNGAVMMFSLLDIAMSLYETGATFGDFKIEEYHRF